MSVLCASNSLKVIQTPAPFADNKRNSGAKLYPEIDLSVKVMDFPLGLGLVPLLWAIFTLTGVLFCYFYSVFVGHVYPLVPSISNTGTRRPEGDIFAEIMNISSFHCLFIMYIRYIQVRYRAAKSYENIERVNLVSLIAGATTGVGITLVANFPSVQVCG